MKRLSLATILVFSLLFIFFSKGYLVSKTEPQFNVTENFAFFNYLNNFTVNITVGNNGNFNLTLNISNSTLLENSLLEKVNFLIYNLTNFDNIFFIENGSYKNFTIIINSSNANFGRYVGNLSIFNTTNSSINITEFFIIADIPLNLESLTQQHEIKINSSRLYFIGSITGNWLDYWEQIWLNNALENSTFSFIKFNDSIDYIVFDIYGNIVTHNIYNFTLSEIENLENRDKEILFPLIFPVKILINKINKSDNLILNSILNFTIKTSTINISFINSSINCKEGVLFTVVCSLNVNQTVKNEFNLTNNFNSNYTNLIQKIKTPFIKIELKDIFFNNSSQSPTNRTFEFLVPKDAIEIFVVLNNWKNDSSNFNFNIKNLTPYRERNNSLFKFVEKAYSNFEKNRKYLINITANNTDFYDLEVRIYLNKSIVTTNFTLTNLTIFENKNYDINISLPEYFLGSSEYYTSLIFEDFNKSKTGLLLIIKNEEPNFEVNGFLNSTILKINENRGFNKTIKIPITIFNRNFTTVSNNLTLTSIINSTRLNSSNDFVYYYHDLNLTSSLNISSNDFHIFNITLDLNSSKQVGVYKDTIILISSNGVPTKNFTLFLELNLTNILNVDVLEISPLKINPNSNFNISVVPRYQNGSFVNGLSKENFTVIFNRTVFSTNYTFYPTINNVLLNGEKYILNTSIGDVLGGNFSLLVKVRDNYGNEGIGELKDVFVNQSLLTLEAFPQQTSFSSSTSIPVSLVVRNLGNKNESNVYVNITTSYCNPEWSYIVISSLPAGSSYSNSSAFKVVTQNNTNCGVTVLGYLPNNFHPNYKTVSFQISWQPIQQPQGGQPQQPQQNQPQQNYPLEIVDSPTLIIVEKNGTNTTKVKVKNSATVNQDISLTLIGIDKKYYEVIPRTQSINSNEVKEFTLRFLNVDLNISEYNLILNASSNYNFTTRNFKLRVIPSFLEISQINSTILTLENVLKEIEINLTNLEKLGKNVSELRNELNNLKSELNNLKSEFENKKYFEVYNNMASLSTKVSNLLDVIKALGIEKVEQEEEKKGLSLIDYIIIVIIIAAIGVLVYMLLPPNIKFLPQSK